LDAVDFSEVLLHMKTRSRAGLLALLGVITVLALIFGVTQYRQAKAANLRLEASRQRALFGLISRVENVEAGLAKARGASTTAQQTTFLTSAYSQAQVARDTLLPGRYRFAKPALAEKRLAEPGQKLWRRGARAAGRTQREGRSFI
jgi:hypothetical protein